MIVAQREYNLSPETLREGFAAYQQQTAVYNPPPPNIAADLLEPHTETMADLTREELNAKLEACEARVAAAVESMRADWHGLRADVTQGIAEIRTQGERSQAAADRFYAEAGRVLAEIRLAGEKNRSTVMELGYRVAAWVFGAIVTLGSLYFTVRKAVEPPPVASAAPAPQPAPTAQPAPKAPPLVE